MTDSYTIAKNKNNMLGIKRQVQIIKNVQGGNKIVFQNKLGIPVFYYKTIKGGTSKYIAIFILCAYPCIV